MSDFSSEKIKELLNDPANLERIASLVGSMSGGGLAGLFSQSAPDTPQEPASDALPASDTALSQTEDPASSQAAPVSLEAEATVPDEKAVFAPSGSPLPAIGNLSSKVSGDKRITLLKAIRPYVNDEKKERVDGLVRAISVAGLLNNYKNTLLH